MEEKLVSPGARRIVDLLGGLDPAAPPWDEGRIVEALTRLHRLLGHPDPVVEIVASPVAFADVVGRGEHLVVGPDPAIMDAWSRLVHQDDPTPDAGDLGEPYTWFVHAYVHLPDELDQESVGIEVDSAGYDLYYHDDLNILAAVRRLALRYERDWDASRAGDPLEDRIPHEPGPARRPDSPDGSAAAAEEVLVDALLAGAYRWWPLPDRVLVLPFPAVHSDVLGLVYDNPDGPAIRWPDGHGTYVIEGVRVPAHLGMAVACDELTLDQLEDLPERFHGSSRSELVRLLVPYLPLATQFRSFTPELVHRGIHDDALWLVTDNPYRDPYTLLIVTRDGRVHGYPRSALLASFDDPVEALADAWAMSPDIYRRHGRPAYPPARGPEP